jgi:hypothetical protein
MSEEMRRITSDEMLKLSRSVERRGCGHRLHEYVAASIPVRKNCAPKAGPLRRIRASVLSPRPFVGPSAVALRLLEIMNGKLCADTDAGARSGYRRIAC